METQLPEGAARRGPFCSGLKAALLRDAPGGLERKMLQKQRGEGQAEAGVSSLGFVHSYTGVRLRRLEAEREMLVGQENGDGDGVDK